MPKATYKKRCFTRRCPNEATIGELCSSCYKRKWREENRLRDSYHNHVSNCIKRKIPNYLTFEDYSELAIKTDYINKKGRMATSYTLDRLDNNRKVGYRKGNIAVRSKSENSSKGTKKLFIYDYRTKFARYIPVPSVDEDAYF